MKMHQRCTLWRANSITTRNSSFQTVGEEWGTLMMRMTKGKVFIIHNVHNNYKKLQMTKSAQSNSLTKLKQNKRKQWILSWIKVRIKKMMTVLLIFLGEFGLHPAFSTTKISLRWLQKKKMRISWSPAFWKNLFMIAKVKKNLRRVVKLVTLRIFAMLDFKINWERIQSEVSERNKIYHKIMNNCFSWIINRRREQKRSHLVSVRVCTPQRNKRRFQKSVIKTNFSAVH